MISIVTTAESQHDIYIVTTAGSQLDVYSDHGRVTA